VRSAARALAIAAIVLSASSVSAAGPDVPYLTGRVVDETGILSSQARARLTDTLKNHEDATTNQIVVLTVPSIDGASIEEYAVRVFQSWKLGQKGKDNGVLVIVVPQDRKMRIEVGYGLEPTLTDAICGDIIRTWMTPAFRNGDYDRGVEDGVGAIVARLENRPMAMSSRPAARRVVVERRPVTFDVPRVAWPLRILMGAFVFGIIGLFTVLGVMTPGSGWFLYVFLIPFWAMFPIMIVGTSATLALLAAYLIGYPIAKLRLRRTPWYQKAAEDIKAKGYANIGGFVVSGSSGGGFSGGGFSGGGGSSGGGGASGSW
jgi:uncharacterized protein